MSLSKREGRVPPEAVLPPPFLYLPSPAGPEKAGAPPKQAPCIPRAEPGSVRKAAVLLWEASASVHQQLQAGRREKPSHGSGLLVTTVCPGARGGRTAQQQAAPRHLPPFTSARRHLGCSWSCESCCSSDLQSHPAQVTNAGSPRAPSCPAGARGGEPAGGGDGESPAQRLFCRPQASRCPCPARGAAAPSPGRPPRGPGTASAARPATRRGCRRPGAGRRRAAEPSAARATPTRTRSACTTATWTSSGSTRPSESRVGRAGGGGPARPAASRRRDPRGSRRAETRVCRREGARRPPPAAFVFIRFNFQMSSLIVTF